MALDREALFVALFARLQTSVGSIVKSYSRRWASWDDAPPTMQPALLLLKGPEKVERPVRGGPLLWRLTAHILVYAKDDGTGEAVPDTLLNQILTAIEAALEVQPDEATAVGAQYLARRDVPPAGTTLGGLCETCQMTGTVETYAGTQGHDGMIDLEVEILAFASGGFGF